MLRNLLHEEVVLQESNLVENIYESLKDIQQKMEDEMAYKQKTIEKSYDEIRMLRKAIEEKDITLKALKNKLDDCHRNNEGNRQLINKLLNDLDRAHQDIEWYKRTYESRSLLGTIKEKLVRKIMK